MMASQSTPDVGPSQPTATTSSFPSGSAAPTGPVQDLLDVLDAAGYVTDLCLVDLAPMLAAGRTVSRFLSSGRFVDPIYTLDVMGTNPQTAFEELKTHPGASVDSRGWTRASSSVSRHASSRKARMPKDKQLPERKRLPPGGYPSLDHLRDEDFETEGVFDFDKATGAVFRESFKDVLNPKE